MTIDPYRHFKAALELDGTYIGNMISFDWNFPSSFVSARITGVLRQIRHSSTETIFQLSGEGDLDNGEMTEFVLERGATVNTDPTQEL